MPDGSASPGIHTEETADGTSVRFNGRYLTSPTHPQTSIRNRMEAVRVETQTIYVLASPLLGYAVAEFVERLPDSSCLVCVEADSSLSEWAGEVVERALKTLGASGSADRRVLLPVLLHARHPSSAALSIAGVMPETIRRCRLISFTGGMALHREYYQQLERLIVLEISRRWRNSATLIHFGRKWIRQLFRNCLEPSVPLPQRTIFASDPIVVAAAGESLENHLAFLKDNRSKVRVLAVDTAIGPLVSSGIQPDAILTIESQSVNTGHFHGACFDNTILIHDLTAHPDTLRLAAPDRRLSLLTEFASLGILERLTTARGPAVALPGLGSVGLAACALAGRLSSGPILLAGFDFAYTPGKPHARGSLTHGLALTHASRLAAPLLYASSLGRPLVRGATAEGVAFSSDTVLTSYVRFLGETLPSDRSFTLPRLGPDLTVPAVSHAEASALLDGHSSPARTPGGVPVAEAMARIHGTDGPPDYWVRRMREFVRNEIELIRTIDAVSAAQRELEPLKYAWMDFPELLDKRAFDPSDRRKIRTRLRSYRSYIEQLLSAT